MIHAHTHTHRVKGGPTSPGFSATSWAVPQNQMLGDGGDGASLHDLPRLITGNMEYTGNMSGIMIWYDMV